jgi:Ca-activated chloride channel homolog
MNKKGEELKTELCCMTDKQVVPAGKESTRILEIGVTAPVVADKKVKLPLNLSLVIDRSGSMKGEKLHYAKQAAAHLVDLLEKSDRVGIVMYDTNIDVVSPSREMSAANKSLVKSELQQISSRGSTNLFDGWLKGCEQVAENESKNSFNRALLLSDGKANQGLTNIDEIATHTSGLFQRGVSTSCFGIGINYNEHLLEAISNAGGGNFHFLEALSAIPIAFEREFEELINMSLNNATVEIELPAGCSCDLSGGWPGVQNGQVFTVSLGNLFSGRQQNIYFQMHIPSILEGASLTLPIKLKAKMMDGTQAEIAGSVNFSAVDLPAEEQTVSDPELMARFALVDMADRATEALKLAREGNRAGASTMLGQSMGRHSRNMSPAARQKYEYMTNEIKDGLNEMGFKRHHQEEYANKRARMDARDYHLQRINGHLFTTIDRMQVLLDTGIPISMGPEQGWYFMHELHPMSQGYLGLTLENIRQFVDAPIHVLMGTDVLKKKCLLFELKRERISFSSRPLIRSQHNFQLSLLMGVPGLNIDVSGEACEMFLDTGSKLSYVSSAFTKDLKSKGTEKDFYPGLGEFETEVYEVELSLGDLAFTLRCGVLPSLLETTLLVSGKKGIIGVEFFKKFTVQLDFPNKIMSLRS